MALKEFFRPFLSNLLDSVLQQSLEDDVITPEESVLLSQIEIDVRAFEKEIAKQIEAEGGLSKNLDTISFKNRLIDSVRKLALKDGTISRDEEAIISKLEEYFNNQSISQ
ncbi:MAG: hypothetical protein GF308_15955 [Candidatus Heimdallarchaeota archaeon]|nr:hypothetical protein [Candidatus Heimdallarchaeota archaeon]